MDRITVALRTEGDEPEVRRLIREIGLAVPTAAFETDSEVTAGFREAREAFGFSCFLFLGLDSKDKSSNRVTQETFEHVCEGRPSRLEKLVRRLETMERESDPWIIFAYSWESGQDVVYYEGGADSFSAYLRLIGGAYRTTYNISNMVANIDLDTPLLWKITNPYGTPRSP